MSFVVDLAAEQVTASQGAAIEAAIRRRGAWPIHYVPAHVERRWLLRRRAVAARLVMPDHADGSRLLSEQATWDQPFWDLAPEARARLAASFRILGELLPQGFRFRASWVGDAVRDTLSLSAGELAERAAASEINQHTLYVVPPRAP